MIHNGYWQTYVQAQAHTHNKHKHTYLFLFTVIPASWLSPASDISGRAGERYDREKNGGTGNARAARAAQ